MKKLKMLLCLMSITVGLSATQLQAKAAKEQTGIEVTKETKQESTAQRAKAQSTKNDRSVKEMSIPKAKISSISKKMDLSGYYYYNNVSYTLKTPGLLHINTNNMADYVYVYNVTTGKVAYSYADSSSGYHATFSLGKGTYRVLISGYDYLNGLRYTSIRTEVPQFLPTKNKTVVRDDNFYFKSTYYVKVKARKTGVLTIKPLANSMYVKLVNARKKALSTDQYYYKGSSASYGIKKGATYYVKVTSSMRARYAMKFTSIKEKSGSKKSKAAKLSKKNRWSHGTLLAGSKTADWYKIKLNKKSKLNIILKPQICNVLKLSVYGPNGKRWGDVAKITPYSNGTERKFQLYTSNWISKNYKIDAGTYYVKIERGSKYTSGSYSIKWK
ncbi:hypothetical protein [Anaerosacchariphilus polymeriproducens]|uniref:F5/8 type C domain-containing protein n=1 Tax=Anaerosacchariphilus polymeriproducens TaxID=1812858 RepID=A0A371AWG7_9FIRM|nr:hypothetical protein [Anaerosacchariphilus polymeriproducens]RDU23925.1 hypothetical protein DWV06_06420 [Anaerosacchariphilus polymeriproducens]